MTRGAHQKRAVLLISDGQYKLSLYFQRVARLLKESDVVVYRLESLAARPRQRARHARAVAARRIVGSLRRQSFFPNTAAEMDDIFERIALELRHQYSIRDRPGQLCHDGKWPN